jgi:hypothetical protein
LTGPAPSGMTCALGRIRTCNLLIRRSGSDARRVALAWSGRPLRCLSCLGWWWTTGFRTHRDPHRTVAGLASCLGESNPRPTHYEGHVRSLSEPYQHSSNSLQRRGPSRAVSHMQAMPYSNRQPTIAMTLRAEDVG